MNAGEAAATWAAARRAAPSPSRLAPVAAAEAAAASAAMRMSPCEPASSTAPTAACTCFATDSPWKKGASDRICKELFLAQGLRLSKGASQGLTSTALPTHHDLQEVLLQFYIPGHMLDANRTGAYPALAAGSVAKLYLAWPDISPQGITGHSGIVCDCHPLHFCQQSHSFLVMKRNASLLRHHQRSEHTPWQKPIELCLPCPAFYVLQKNMLCAAGLPELRALATALSAAVSMLYQAEFPASGMTDNGIHHQHIHGQNLSSASATFHEGLALKTYSVADKGLIFACAVLTSVCMMIHRCMQGETNFAKGACSGPYQISRPVHLGSCSIATEMPLMESSLQSRPLGSGARRSSAGRPSSSCPV